jgi:hypothetical protein
LWLWYRSRSVVASTSAATPLITYAISARATEPPAARLPAFDPQMRWCPVSTKQITVTAPARRAQCSPSQRILYICALGVHRWTHGAAHTAHTKN